MELPELTVLARFTEATHTAAHASAIIGSPGQEIQSYSVMSTPPSAQSVPRSVFSTSCSIFGGSPPQIYERSGSGSDAQGSLYQTDGISYSGHSRFQSTGSITIYFPGARAHALGLGFNLDSPVESPVAIQNDKFEPPIVGEADQGERADVVGDSVMDRNMSASTTNSLSSEESNCSGLTNGSSSSASYSEPITPSDGFFMEGPGNIGQHDSRFFKKPAKNENSENKMDNRELHVDATLRILNGKPCSDATHQRNQSETSNSSAFSISEYYGNNDYSGDSDEPYAPLVNNIKNQVFNVSPPRSISRSNQLLAATPVREPSDSKLITPEATPTQVIYQNLLNSACPQKKVLLCDGCSPVKVESGGLPTNSSSKASPLQVSFAETVGTEAKALYRSRLRSQSLSANVKRATIGSIAVRRFSPPHCKTLRATQEPSLKTPPVIDNYSAGGVSTIDKDFCDQISLNYHSRPLSNMFKLVEPSILSAADCILPLNCNIVQRKNCPSTSNTATSSRKSATPHTNKNLIHEHESEDLPVGELFRTLQIWFDQEGFREIAPIFTFSYYNREDDLLYFTTDRVGYPFHYDPMQQVPIMRKVVAPDYEEAYALLEGKASRNAAGRRDFISRQASLNMKTEGKYKVEDTEGKGGKWIWRLVYEVEERKSLMGRPMCGERAFIPITFACSPEVLDPSHARKPTFLNAIIKNIGSKKAAIALDAQGRPITRPRGKSLISYQYRKRSESTTRLLETPSRNLLRSNPVEYEATPSIQSIASATVNTDSGGYGDELSLGQSQFFKTISPASASPLRPLTSDENTKRGVRKVKTSENLRRPFTADPSLKCYAPPVPSLPTHFPNITPVFGIAPQPSRATPSTLAGRFQNRPKTSDDRKQMTERRPMTAKSQLDIKRIAAASFFTPPELSA
ncbi:hypothetical protein BY996DRAFT_6420047 [Phakopsora pachyrhizi]|uniref:Uncharacterized protein n=1 Tax=Phakopsora pachyrhizi TaxID=170000 RepID=A0AAV0B7V6_PHAPC|nr:hypothetical protein BY996DRAFT_6420047 [Phakopsora pachyrhizi]CAH7681634.1 hypothetical protein PPACK8108_LOCUS14261 [Phakopsora pachyrhizi]